MNLNNKADDKVSKAVEKINRVTKNKDKQNNNIGMQITSNNGNENIISGANIGVKPSNLEINKPNNSDNKSNESLFKKLGTAILDKVKDKAKDKLGEVKNKVIEDNNKSIVTDINSDSNERDRRILEKKKKIQQELEEKDIRLSMDENRQRMTLEKQQIEFEKKQEEHRLINEDLALKDMIANENLREQRILENERVLQRNEAILDEQEDIIRRERTTRNSEFNFYKLRDIIKEENHTFVEALNKTGMIPNVHYNLDYEGNKICRIHNRNSDDVCANLKQNKVFAKLIKDEKAITCIVGKPYETDFEIGILTCDFDFGAILFTRYKEPDKYIFDVGNRLEQGGLIGYGQMANIKLSKSFIKVAFNSAIKIDLDKGITNEEDMNMYIELCKNNEVAKEKLKYLLHALGVKVNRGLLQ